LNKTKSHANFRFAWLLFFFLEQADGQREEVIESRKKKLLMNN